MKKIKKYGITDDTLNNIPIVDSKEGNFDKYKKDKKSTTWLIIENNQLRFLQQININNHKYCGFITEPYLLFLDYSKQLSLKIEIIEKSFSEKTTEIIELKEDFKLNLLEQETFDNYLVYKINFIMTIIMSLESYLNNLIPDTTTYNGINKQRIEKEFSIKQKLKDVVPLFKNIGDQKEYESKYSEILRLNNLRNDFAHLKTRAENNNMDSFLNDFESILKLNAKKEFNIVSEFISYVENLEYLSN